MVLQIRSTVTYKSSTHPLDDFEEDVDNLISTRHLQQGFKTQRSIMNDIRLYMQQNMITIHVSATNLLNQSAPTSLTHHRKLHPDNKKIWDEAYQEECIGLYSA